MLIVAEEGSEISNSTLPILFYARDSKNFIGHPDVPFHEGFLNYVLQQSISVVYILPKYSCDKWVSVQSLVSIGRGWLKLTRFKPKVSLKIKVYIENSKPEIKKIVPNLMMEISSNLSFASKDSARLFGDLGDNVKSSESQTKRLKLGPSSPDTSVNHLKLQKPYLEWIPDQDKTIEEYGANTLASMMEDGNRRKDKFYGRSFRNEKV